MPFHFLSYNVTQSGPAKPTPYSSRNKLKGGDLKRPSDENSQEKDAKDVSEHVSRIIDTNTQAPVTTAGMPDAVLVVDEQGKIAAVDAESELTFGYSRSDIVGTTLEMLLSESVEATHSENQILYDRNSAVLGMSKEGMLLGRDKAGIAFKALVKSSPIVIPSGRYTIITIYKIRT